jgi:hypothetical protein
MAQGECSGVGMLSERIALPICSDIVTESVWELDAA